VEDITTTNFVRLFIRLIDAVEGKNGAKVAETVFRSEGRCFDYMTFSGVWRAGFNLLAKVPRSNASTTDPLTAHTTVSSTRFSAQGD
jgi:hypothetical protein